MKGVCIAVDRTGGPEVLSVKEQDVRAPGAGEVLVRSAAAGVNFIDVYFRARHLATSYGLHSLAPGDRVAWTGVPGSYAQLVMAPAASLVRLPDGVDDETAAAAMLQGMTAHYLAHGTRQTRPGDTALVHAAAGGTGLLLVQTLARAGARPRSLSQPSYD